jgi:release factor glutamine methyltransferase
MAATLRERVAEGRRRLMASGLAPADAALDAEVLARHALGWDRATLLTRGADPPPRSFIEEFTAAVARRAAREPVAYITGHREFWGLDFEVTPDVLIPRPETELVVEAALALRERMRRGRILDVGTGSGCLAVALAAELPGARVAASDTSRAALALARRNAERHGVAARVSFLLADLLTGIRGPVDLLVSNPPYIPRDADLPPEVAKFEPSAALFAGPDGLDALRRLIADAPPVLAPGGTFIVEFGFGQADSVRSMAHAAGWRHVEVRSDLQDIPRVALMSMSV